MSIESAFYTLSHIDFPQWGIMGTILVILQNVAINNCDTLIKWLLAAIGALSSVVVYLFINTKGEIKELNARISKLQEDHAQELREIEINNITAFNKVIDTLNRYESNKKG